MKQAIDQLSCLHVTLFLEAKRKTMTVRELISTLILMPQDAQVYVDCSVDYPECGKISSCQQWKDMEQSFRERYGWSQPEDDDVFLN